MIGRLEGWEGRLARFVEERRNMPFEWGRNDCVTAASDWVLSATGRRPILERFDHTDERSAARVMLEHGCRTVAELATKALGNPINRYASRGDLALVVSDNGPTLSIIVGDRVVAPGASGLVFWPRTAATKFWRVGADRASD